VLGQQQARKKTPSRFPLKAVVYGAIPVVLIAGMVFLLRPFFTSGKETPSETVSAPEIPEARLPDPVSSEREDPLPAITEMPPESVTPATELQAFLQRLGNSTLILSRNPEGLFVDSVFFPEGAILNRELGLVLSRISLDSENPGIRLISSDGETFDLPVPVGP
jgi:hypothetical protein